MIGDGFWADTHVHSHFSQDSESALSDICRAAKEKYIGTICITDHADVKPTSNMQQLMQTRKDVFREVSDAKNSDVELLLGIELACGGFYPETAIFDEVAKTLLSIGHYDCVIGSVHSVGTIGTARHDYSAMSQQELIAFMSRYFDAVLAMLEYGKPDILAHLTYPFRYINGKYGRNLDWHHLETKIREIYAKLIQNGVALEINTSSLGTCYDSFMPEEDMVKMYLEMGGCFLTLGSDAHKPENLGKGFAQAIQFLKTLDVKELYYVKNRQLHSYEI